MKKRTKIQGSILSLIILVLLATKLAYPELTVGGIVNNVFTPNNGEVVSSSKLTCFEYIDKQFVADGYTYLEGAKWGRGENNMFIIDAVAQEFQLADWLNAKLVPIDWYKTDFGRYNMLTYNYADNKVWDSQFLNNGGSKDSPSAVYYGDIADTNSMFYDFPKWMEYYNTQFSKVGCTLNGLTEETLLGQYKTKKSNATDKDIISVFDRKSTDGELKYFMDAHQPGNVEDHPRYKELNTKQDYLALDNAINMEATYIINIVYHEPSKFTFDTDFSGIQGSALIKEFTKDILFTQTTWIGDKPENMTIGVYFIYVDNPNNVWASMYRKPVKGVRLNQATQLDMSKFSKFSTPYDGVMLVVNKNEVAQDKWMHRNLNMNHSMLENYIDMLKIYNPEMKIADDFVANYTRPFNQRWQSFMGLTKHFEAKYGYIDQGIVYTN